MPSINLSAQIDDCQAKPNKRAGFYDRDTAESVPQRMDYCSSSTHFKHLSALDSAKRFPFHRALKNIDGDTPVHYSLRQVQRIDLIRPPENPAEPLVKNTVADRLRSEIASGRLRPGMRIVEGTWAREFGVAQGSIREAINLLAQDGFVTKAAGRSARVVSLSEHDVLHIFELRGVVEGLAARLLAQTGAHTDPLDNAVERMRQAYRDNRPEEMLDADLTFHMELCRLSGNSHLLEHARKLLIPMFAFARIRVLSSGQDATVWGKDLEAHQRIVDLVREGDGSIAEQYVRHAISRFGQDAYDNWEKKSAGAGTNRSSRSSPRVLGAGADLPPNTPASTFRL